MDEEVVNVNSNVSDSDEPVLLNIHLSNKVECFAPEDNNDEIDAFLAMEMEIENSNEPVLLQTPLSDKVECFDPGDDIDEIDAFLDMEISMDYEEGYYDSEGDVTFLDNLLSDDWYVFNYRYLLPLKTS
ncbi:hypothetical protein Tco_0346616 [Tanacetum coccineum]